MGAAGMQMKPETEATRMVRVSREGYERILELKAGLEREQQRVVSISEVLDDILGIEQRPEHSSESTA